MAKKKFYVVWHGVRPGVYESWEDAKAQVESFEGALYKSFSAREEAENALNENPSVYIGNKEKNSFVLYKENPAVIQNSMAVDAACSGNPGLLEYRGVYLLTGKEIFHQGTFEHGTNNIGEFLAIVHALALLKQKNSDIPLYSDSATAIAWVREKKCKTKLERTSLNQSLFYMIEKAEKWLRENSYITQIIKWNTSKWGEIPADFGRK